MAELKLGIDFGTCNIKIRRWHKKKGAISYKFDDNQNNSDGKVPNVIHYYQNESGNIEKIIGEEASESTDYENIVEYIKYFLQKKNWKKYIPALKKEITSYEVLTDIFSWIYETICTQNGGKSPEGVVITVPVSYSELQKKQIINAAKDVGFNVADVIYESVPTAFYNAETFENDQNSKILVFDFGGSTLDMSIIEIKCKNSKKVRVRSSIGLNYGGIDINKDIYEKILLPKYEALKIAENDINSENVKKELYREIEKIKRRLFKSDEEQIEQKWHSKVISDFNITISLSKKEFISMVKEKGLDKKILGLLDEVFEYSGLAKNDITDIYYVGGTSRIGYFKELLESKFDSNLIHDIDEDEMYTTVASGAARYYFLQSEENIQIQNCLSYEVGIQGKDGYFQKILSRNTRFGKNSMSMKRPCIVDKNGCLNVYQIFVKNGELDIKKSDDVIYMGSFKLLPENYPSGKISFELYVDNAGKLRANFYDNGKLIENDKELVEYVRTE